MNNFSCICRLTKDVEVRYGQGATPTCVARYGIAIKKRFHKQGEAEADFFNVVAFGKAAEFAEKFFKKGMQVGITGRIENNNYEKQDGTKVFGMQIVAETQDFAESKGNSEQQQSTQGFIPTGIDDSEDDLPF